MKLFRHPRNLLDVALVQTQTLLAESVFPRMSCALCAVFSTSGIAKYKKPVKLYLKKVMMAVI